MLQIGESLGGFDGVFLGEEGSDALNGEGFGGSLGETDSEKEHKIGKSNCVVDKHGELPRLVSGIIELSITEGFRLQSTFSMNRI